MLDQSFSADNFRKIIDIENRKGIYLEGEFFPEIVAVSQEIKKCNSDLRALKKIKHTFLEEDYETERARITEIKEAFRLDKEELYKEKLSEISTRITTKGFKLELEKDTTITSKPVYKVPHLIDNIFTSKQLQYNFRKLYKVKQTSRFAIVSQLKSLLDDGFPKIIVRTDIESFYESIPQDILTKKLNDENLLTHLSRKFITQILLSYNDLSHSATGVPRGIGISAYLVELYMREIDSKIKSLPNVMYYARYVDDIVVMFTPRIDTVSRDYNAEVKQVISHYGLTVNDKKTKCLDNTNRAIVVKHELEYLGYRFIFGNERSDTGKTVKMPLNILISTKKKRRYKIKIIKAFESYTKESFKSEKKARKLLVKRMRFLMGNTKLVNNKKNVATGIYFTNNLINNTTDLKDLDLFFNRRLLLASFPANLKKRLSYNNSFERGFNPSTFSEFSGNDLRNIMQAWK